MKSYNFTYSYFNNFLKKICSSFGIFNFKRFDNFEMNQKSLLNKLLMVKFYLLNFVLDMATLHDAYKK